MQDRGRFSVLVKKVVFFQGKSIKSLKYDANNTQDTEPSSVLCPNSQRFCENYLVALVLRGIRDGKNRKLAIILAVPAHTGMLWDVSTKLCRPGY